MMRAVVVVMAVLAVSLAGVAWRGAGETMHQFFGVPPSTLGDFAERTSAWLDKNALVLRERFAALVDSAEVAAPKESPGGESSAIRIYRGRDIEVLRVTPSTSSSAGAPRIYRGRDIEAKARTISGSAHVLDGDTLEVRGVRVRLYGIDAPESRQSCRAGGSLWPCGSEAKRALAGRIGTRRVVCEERDNDSYGRVVAVCSVSGRELNRWMVAEGWAWANRRYSLAYAAEEAQARQASRGVWRGEVMAPWKWRRGERLAGGRQCDIKGNISRKGERFYHVPGGKYYARTRIDTSRGERWFCTEKEARAAGWQRSRR